MRGFGSLHVISGMIKFVIKFVKFCQREEKSDIEKQRLK